MSFSFETDRDGREYCEEIVGVMVALFEIPEDEALGRLNRFWKGKPIVGEHDMVYHREPEYWAKTIYYGKDSFWWMEGAELRPLPYP